MKNMKKLTAALLCGALLAGAFTGCGSRNGAGSAGDGAAMDGTVMDSMDDSITDDSGIRDIGAEAESSSGAAGSEGDSGPGESQYQIPEVNIEPFEVPDTEAFRFVRDMKIGWILGNTFDAFNDGIVSSELDIETAWCGIATTKDMIDDIQAAGFNSVRIPVSWHNHVDEDYRISEAWLDRVQEVVDYAYDNGMYVILNIHHDNSESFMYPDSAHLEQSIRYITTVWEQLCRRFGEYDQHLIFECMNEPRLVGSQYEWWINAGAEECKDAISCINRINQEFVNTVRAAGGSNLNRYLMVPGYDASPDGALNSGFVLPTDAEGVEDKLIVSVHAYTPYNFALQAEGESGSTAEFDSDSPGSVADINSFMDRLYTKFISNGVPVIIGEFGSRDKGQNLQARIDHAAYYVAAARARGMSCLWWDNNAFTGDGENFGLYYRRSGRFLYPDIVAALMKYAD
ncbi:MAG: glycoside hydrolase family 5 protein [Butyrivibrio sp.]|nr:glycoside hydrolase family 5 protein [Acetatifactor muris]MCM1558604.1 glycoside hydrolase family 5 protein [Butyrivibrio sp.]